MDSPARHSSTHQDRWEAENKLLPKVDSFCRRKACTCYEQSLSGYCSRRCNRPLWPLIYGHPEGGGETIPSDRAFSSSPQPVDLDLRLGVLLPPVGVLVEPARRLAVHLLHLGLGLAQLGLRVLELGLELVLLRAGLVQPHLPLLQLALQRVDLQLVVGQLALVQILLLLVVLLGAVALIT